MSRPQSTPWDEDRAQDLIGARVVVGITHIRPGGADLEQLWGSVIAAEEGVGISLRLEGLRAGEIYTLPPDLDAFHRAEPGEYRLKSTGEIVANPDYTTSWTINPPLQ